MFGRWSRRAFGRHGSLKFVLKEARHCTLNELSCGFGGRDFVETGTGGLKCIFEELGYFGVSVRRGLPFLDFIRGVDERRTEWSTGTVQVVRVFGIVVV